ncbi:MAG TPA: acyl-CoA synthetase [Ilumatobacter sp.]|nr:acyl-CoA synthetase [Ilumatobacter sp.]
MDETLQHPSRFAVTAPDRLAVIMGESGETLTYGQLEDRSCRVGNLLRSRGVATGSHVAILVENRKEFFEVLWGGMRTGMFVTPINWHLAPGEAAYIIRDCGASALFASAGVPRIDEIVAATGDLLAVSVAIGGTIDGFDDYESALADQPNTRPADECEGNFMFYSSGTTGQPKGIKPQATGGSIGLQTGFTMLVQFLYGGGEDTVYLSPAPLYHAAPAGWTTTMHRLGGTAVVMERFDPHKVLELIQTHRVTHVQFVPTHLIRLLKLPAADRAQFDHSSLKYAIHAAAPCPIEVKQAALDWLGPVVYEYYSGSEGAGFCAIGPEEWIAHPGSVGKSMMGPVHIIGPDREELPAGEEGEVWFEAPQPFEYHGDAEKTAEAHDDRGWSTIGDVGRVDADGYLYLTDRVSNMIISGGVNIYPREIEDILVVHPKVADAAVIGVPHADLGETVRAVVQVAPGILADEAFADELIEHCRERLSHFKCPTSVAFLDELPRLPTGKLAKRMLPASVRSVDS